jgi:hypothetical protein
MSKGSAKLVVRRRLGAKEWTKRYGAIRVSSTSVFESLFSAEPGPIASPKPNLLL